MGWESRNLPSRYEYWGHAVYLLREVERFLKTTSIPATRFGREVMGDPRFVFDLRNGREPRTRTINRVRAFLDSPQ